MREKCICFPMAIGSFLQQYFILVEKSSDMTQGEYLSNFVFPPELLHFVFWKRSGSSKGIDFLINHNETETFQ